jgi:sodium/hydrogen exchanger-like protein 6/7
MEFIPPLLLNTFGSMAIGLACGFAGCLILKHFKSLQHEVERTIFLMMMFAYLAFATSRYFEFSQIITLFTVACILGRYGKPHLNKVNQETTSLAIETMSSAAEAFMYIYLGMHMFSIN